MRLILNFLSLELLKDRAITQNNLDLDQALWLFDFPDLELLLGAAHFIREKKCGNSFEFCSILNVKSGLCSEDCKYCAQSSHHSVSLAIYDFLEEETILQIAKEREKEKIPFFSLVSSGNQLNSENFEKLLKTIYLLKKHTSLFICVSIGKVSLEQALELKKAGITRFHHNIETSSDYFKQICTTHSWEERIETIQIVQSVGIEVCSGVLWGMGEKREDRIESILVLKKMGIRSIPLNFLIPIPGTAFQNITPLSSEEILRSIAVTRFLMPDVKLRYAGGRILLGNAVEKGLKAGINAAITGNLLTTSGSSILEDKKLVIKNNFEVIQ